MCKFGVNCKFDHPKDLRKTSNGENEMGTAVVSITPDATSAVAKPSSGYKPAVLYNSKHLPIRLVYVSSCCILNILRLHFIIH
jgi:hypothetical protein